MNKAETEGQITKNIPDKEIIERVLDGNKEYYALIIKRYNQRLYRVGMSILGDDLEVEDVMQVAYINAYENLKKFAFKSSFSTWLTRILINECLLRVKKRKKQTFFLDNEISPNFMTEKQSAAAKVLNAELKNALEQAIQRLPEIYRIVFIMREVEDMSIAETRECLEISDTNVKVRLNRAKVLLRQSLSDYYKKDEVLGFHLTRCDRMVQTVMQCIESY